MEGKLTERDKAFLYIIVAYLALCILLGLYQDHRETRKWDSLRSSLYRASEPPHYVPFAVVQAPPIPHEPSHDERTGDVT